ncbi:MAG: hypothetical protein EBR58_10400, partial [Betaproteobacteria bacterium]|nr:hypothetical protein [Betaproteobacteria bacterium]
MEPVATVLPSAKVFSWRKLSPEDCHENHCYRTQPLQPDDGARAGSANHGALPAIARPAPPQTA